MKKTFTTIISSLLVLAANSQTFSNQVAIPPTLSGPSFNLTVKDTAKEFTPGLTSQTFAINNMDYLGPTLIFQQGETVDFTIDNATAADSITIHWHGMHLPAVMDGGPMNEILPGGTWSPSYDVLNQASMMWYHSHAHERTLYQVNKGIAGMIIIQDTIESQLNLPRTYGIDDFPLIFQDKEINMSNGNLEPALLGDTMMVNGTLDPFIELPAQVVRLRVINTSIERVYMFGIDDNRDFVQIGTDGGLLEAPVTLNRLPLGPGERADLLIDLGGETVGTDLFLMSYSTEFNGLVAGSCNTGPGCGSGPMDSTDFQVMRLNVIAQTGSPVTTIPASLTTIDWLVEANVDTTRVKNLNNPSSPGSPFTINGGSFDMSVINDYVPLGNTEIWTFVNTSSIAHPMHIHDVQFNILRRDGVAPPANELGWKDVVLVYPNETVEVIAEFMKFPDPVYTYMMHCHSLGHEDYGMMEQFVIVDTTSIDITDLPLNGGIKVFPNPASDKLTIEFSQEVKNIDVGIYNQLGQVKSDLQVSGISDQIDISSLPSGMYYVVLFSKNKVISHLKFLKE